MLSVERYLNMWQVWRYKRALEKAVAERAGGWVVPRMLVIVMDHGLVSKHAYISRT